MDRRNRGSSNVVKMLLGYLVNVVVLAVAIFLVPRVLGAESYGRFAAVMAVVVIVQTAAGLGLQQVEVRFLSPAWRNPEHFRYAVQLGSTLWTARWALALFAGVLTGVWLEFSALDLTIPVVLSAACLALLRAAHEATRSQFLPLERVGLFMSLEVSQAILTVTGVVLAYLFLGFRQIFTILAALQILVLGFGIIFLLRLVPLRFGYFRWTLLQPHIGYGLSSFGAVVAGIVHQQFSIFALATWADVTTAAILAFSLQMTTVVRGVYLAARRALMPILSELAAVNEKVQLRQWGFVLARYGVAASSLGCLAWALFGDEIIQGLLPSEFLPAHQCAGILIGSMAFFSFAASSNGLLLALGHAGWVAIGTAIHTAIVLAGMTFAIGLGGPRIPLHVSLAYLVGALVFSAIAYLALDRRGGVKMPLKDLLWPTIPLLLAWPAFTWSAPLGMELVAFTVFLASYLPISNRLGWNPWGEIRSLALTSFARR